MRKLTLNRTAAWIDGRWPRLRASLAAWLGYGMTPRQLAFTLALGFALGCLPMLGVTTAICALAAIVLRLNMPAIQAANWLAMPLQLALVVPFLRLGQWILPGAPGASNPQQLMAQLQAAPWQVAGQMGGALGHAMLAWSIAAGPALLVMTVLLTPLLHRMARTREAGAVD